MGPLFVTVFFVASELVQNVYAQPNVVRAAGDEVTRADLKAIQRELNELRNELKVLEVRVTAVEEELNALEAVPRAIGRYLPAVLAAVAGTAVTYFFVTRLSQMRQVPRVAIALFVLGVFDAGAFPATFGNYSYLFSYLLYGIGPIFGAVILVWYNRSPREWINLRPVAFLASSTLIWILVIMVQTGPVYTGPVILGTILLAIAQAELLGASVRRVLIAIPCTFGIWFLGHWYLYYNIFQVPKQHGGLFDVGFAIASAFAILFSLPIWQAAYLLCMFGSVPQTLKILARLRFSRKT